jgi:hypothetical protein
MEVLSSISCNHYGGQKVDRLGHFGAKIIGFYRSDKVPSISRRTDRAAVTPIGQLNPVRAPRGRHDRQNY